MRYIGKKNKSCSLSQKKSDFMYQKIKVSTDSNNKISICSCRQKYGVKTFIYITYTQFEKILDTHGLEALEIMTFNKLPLSLDQYCDLGERFQLRNLFLNLSHTGQTETLQKKFSILASENRTITDNCKYTRIKTTSLSLLAFHQLPTYKRQTRVFLQV